MIDVTVAYATVEKQVELPLSIEESCTVAVAIRRSGIMAVFPEINLATARVGVFSRLVALDALLQAGDRIEIYRPLTWDPKQARRRRAKQQA